MVVEETDRRDNSSWLLWDMHQNDIERGLPGGPPCSFRRQASGTYN